MFTLLKGSTSKVSFRQYSTGSPAIAPKRIGGFKGGFFGFLLGLTVTGFASYYYLIDQYRTANQIIIADVLSLKSTIDSLEKHVKALENQSKN